MRWCLLTILVALTTVTAGCPATGNTGTTTPPANPSPFDGKWTGDLDADGVADCLTISGGLVIAQSTGCTTSLTIIQALALNQQDQNISLVWVNRFKRGAQTVETQLDLEGTVLSSSSIAGSLQFIETADGQPSNSGRTNVTINKVLTPGS